MEGTMKTSLLIATVLAVGSFAGSAVALDISHARTLQVAGIGVNLGVLDFTPLGADGQFCDYLADWASPFNPNDVGICVMQELRTPFTPSCIENERTDIVTLVQSSAVCQGFNLKGEAGTAQLVLSESGCGLSGVAAIGACGMQSTYPKRLKSVVPTRNQLFECAFVGV
jgi:hypothetical protein